MDGHEPKKKVNTVVLKFPRGFPRPSEKDIFAFLQSDHVEPSHIVAIYNESNRNCVFVKFSEIEFMDQYMARKVFESEFVYGNGVKVGIKISDAVQEISAVKLFEVPPEVDDDEIKSKFEEFGVVKKIICCKSSIKEVVPVHEFYNGTRLLYMEIKKDIPNLINIDGVNRRVWYDGIVEQCYRCNEKGHKRADCPLAVNNRLFSKVTGDFPALPKVTDSVTKSFPVTSSTPALQTTLTTTKMQNPRVLIKPLPDTVHNITELLPSGEQTNDNQSTVVVNSNNQSSIENQTTACTTTKTKTDDGDNGTESKKKRKKRKKQESSGSNDDANAAKRPELDGSQSEETDLLMETSDDS